MITFRFPPHLFVAGEILAMELATIHSLHFYQDMMRTAREKILSGTFEPWKDSVVKKWERAEE